MANAPKSWLVTLAVAVLPAAVTGYFSYKSSSEETSAGYVATVKAVEDLQKQNIEMNRELARIGATLSVLESEVLRRSALPPRAARRAPGLVSTAPVDAGVSVHTDAGASTTALSADMSIIMVGAQQNSSVIEKVESNAAQLMPSTLKEALQQSSK